MGTTSIDVLLPEALDGHWSTAEGRELASDYIGKERSDLMMGEQTDFELANGVFMADRRSLDLIAYQTAAKQRIRWLSTQLALATRTPAPSLGEALEQAKKIADDVAGKYLARHDALLRRGPKYRRVAYIEAFNAACTISERIGELARAALFSMRPVQEDDQ